MRARDAAGNVDPTPATSSWKVSKRKRKMRSPSPYIAVAVLAVVAALTGTAVAGPDANTSALSKSKVKKIATKQINALAPGLSVAHAASADTATKAGAAESATRAESAANAANASTLDDLDSTQFQRSGAGGSDTAESGTIPAGNAPTPTHSFPVVGGTFTYQCATTNALWGWGGGPPVEVWQDTGSDDVFHFNPTFNSIQGPFNTNDSDRYQFVFATSNRLAFVDFYSTDTGSECHFAYQLSEYRR